MTREEFLKDFSGSDPLNYANNYRSIRYAWNLEYVSSTSWIYFINAISEMKIRFSSSHFHFYPIQEKD